MEKSIEKEMANVYVTFKVFKGVKPEHTKEGNVKPGFKHVRTHMIFYTKTDGKFTYKDILVADGHKMSPP